MQTIRENTYTTKIGDVTFIVKNTYSGSKSLVDVFEEIIVSAYRKEFRTQFEHDYDY